MRFLLVAAVLFGLSAAAHAQRPMPAKTPPAVESPYGLHAGGGVGLRPPAGFSVGPHAGKYRGAVADAGRQKKRPTLKRPTEARQAP